MMKIVIQDDEGKTSTFPLENGAITIGRGDDVEVRLEERNVSRRHARIVRSNGTVQIEDLGSYNGVRVNGSRIDSTCGLNPADRIQIGDYQIELRADTDEAGVPEIADTAPTIPENVKQPTGNGRAETALTPIKTPVVVMDEALAQEKPTGLSGRLVLVNGRDAGKEFAITDSQLTIGRTDESDIVIDHRSISRQHAKMVRQGERYTIVDLGSANGVHVNGEEYGKVELRDGDIIELGHVKLRFVGPGETFFFTPSHGTDIVDRKKKSMLAPLMLIGAVAAAGVFFVMSQKNSGTNDVPVNKQPTNVVIAGQDGNTDANVEAGNELEEKLSKLLAEAEKSIEEKRWGDARDQARSALVLTPGSERANNVLSQAEGELENQGIYEDFLGAVHEKEYLDVAVLFDRIDANSSYRAEGQEAHDKARKEYFESVSAHARKLAKGQKCRKLNSLRGDLARVESTWPEVHRSVAQVAAKCKEEVVVATKDPPPRNPPPEKQPPKTYEQNIAEARTAMRARRYTRALALCKAALKQKPGDGGTIQTCYVIACKKKNRSLAKKYLDMIPARREALLQTCVKEGIEL